MLEVQLCWLYHNDDTEFLFTFNSDLAFFWRTVKYLIYMLMLKYVSTSFVPTVYKSVQCI